MKAYEPKHLTADQVKGLASQGLPQAEAIVAERWHQYLAAVAALEALEIRAGVRMEEADRTDEVLSRIKGIEQLMNQPKLSELNGEPAAC